MGGAKLAVDGPDLHPEPKSNQIMFKGTWKGVKNTIFKNPPLSSNDEFESKPAYGNLALTMPPAT
jgi:hypothetical protein